MVVARMLAAPLIGGMSAGAASFVTGLIGAGIMIGETCVADPLLPAPDKIIVD